MKQAPTPPSEPAEPQAHLGIEADARFEADARCTVVFCNLWGEGGMRHYSESLVMALAPAARVFYLRNYPSEVASEGFQADLNLNPFRPQNYRALLQIVCAVWRL